MQLKSGERAWDVMIVASTGSAADAAHRLRTALLEHDLRVQLSVLPTRGGLPLPVEVEVEATKAAFCVALGEQSNVIMFALIPAPQFGGQRPSFARGETAHVHEIESGLIVDDVAPLAARIVERGRLSTEAPWEQRRLAGTPMDYDHVLRTVMKCLDVGWVARGCAPQLV